MRLSECFRLAVLAAPCVAMLGAPTCAEEAPVQGAEANSLAKDYCESFSNAAAELRVQHQAEALLKLRNDVTGKLSEVKERTEELKAMIAKRDAMLVLASEELLKIYSKMDSESAARQLEKIDKDTAASVLRRLKPQLASDILSAMDVKRASMLVQIIANQNANIDTEGKS
jgi:flagellar motility protein MotE (MotC chaperone)